MIIKDLHVSLTNMLDAFRQQQFSDNDFDLEVVDFDSHADDATLPLKDIIGLAGFSVQTDHFTYVTVLVGVATYDDFNLTRHREIISALYEKVRPESSHKVYNASTGATKGFMKVESDIKLLPMANSGARPLQFIAISLATDSFITP
jgi:hypothetical protein